MKRIVFFFIALLLFAGTVQADTKWWNSPVGQMFSYGGISEPNLLLDWTLTTTLTPTRAERKTSGFTAPTFSRPSGVVYLDVTDDKHSYETSNDVAVFTQWGIQLEPASTNKVEAYSRLGADLLGSELASGSLTLGKVYKITAQDTANFVADGAADNNVGTEFVCTATTVTLDATNKVQESGGTKISDGTHVSGNGVGSLAKHDGTFTGTTPDSLQQPIPGMTLSGGETEGSELVPGTDSDMSGANDWVDQGFGTYDINSTVAGKMYMLGDGGADEYAQLSSTLTTGKKYSVSLKGRLNAGASTAIRIGLINGSAENYLEFTPTGTEATYSGVFIAGSVHLTLGLTSTLNGIAFEIDDVSVKELTYPATLTNVDATTEVDASDYARILPSKKMYELACTGASVDCTVCFDGALSAADYALSVVAFGATSSDTIELSTDNVSGTPQTVTTGLVRYGETITALAADLMCISAAPNDVITFGLMGAELASVQTSIIIVEGAAATRAATSLTIPRAGNFSQTQGTILVDYTTSYASSDIAAGSYSIVSVHDATGLSVVSARGSQNHFRGSDLTNQPYTTNIVQAAGTTQKVGVLWSTELNRYGISDNGNPITGNSLTAYDGDFLTSGANFIVGNGGYITGTNWIKNIRIYNVDKGTTFVETETTP